MDTFGLTEEEKKTHLHKYNHALFKNMMCFLDIAWEINILEGTVFVLEDKTDPENTGTEFLYEDFFWEYAANRVRMKDCAVFNEYLRFDNLLALREEVTFDIRVSTGKDEWNLHHIVLTPAIDKDGKLYCVYLGASDIQAEERREIAEYYGQEQFREALMSDSYFHFGFDVTGDGLIHENFETRDGVRLIQVVTGMEPPVPFEYFARKWCRMYKPQFVDGQGEDIFTIGYLKKAYARNERLMNIEVKLESPMGPNAIEYMQIFIVLMENPMDRHTHAYIIWRNMNALRRGAIEDNLNLQTSNEELKRTLSQEEQFRIASLSGALMVYNINLTKNLIEHEFYEIVDGKRYPMLQLVGLTAPCSFDTFCERWSQRKVSEDSRKKFLKTFNRQYFLDAYARGEYQLETEFDTVIGRGIPVTLRNTALLVKDKMSGDILAMVHGKDVTAQREEERIKREALRKAYEAANLANSTKSDFLVRMSHDIRTPLNAIIGMTAIAGTNLSDANRISDCLNKIMISSRHLLERIDEMLDIGKLESGSTALEEEEKGVLDEEMQKDDGGEHKSGINELASQDFRGCRALLVEDNELNAEMTEEILKMTGLELEHACNGKEAVDRMSAVEDGYYDIVFMDIQMPVMDGCEAARAIRALDREYTRRVPILAMSANAFAGDVQASLEAGMNEHIVKPFDFNRLKNALEKWIQR